MRDDGDDGDDDDSDNRGDGVDPSVSQEKHSLAHNLLND